MKENKKVWAEFFYKRMQEKLSKTVPVIKGRSPYTTTNGVYENLDFILEWYTGFFGGMLWRMYLETNEEIYKKYACELEEKLDEGFFDIQAFGHDVGFVWYPTAVVDYLVTNNEKSRKRGYLAACALAARYHPNGKFIRAWEHSKYVSIIDTMMNLPLLYWTASITDDERFRIIAENHAETTMRGLIRPDGSARHFVRYDPQGWEVAEVYAGQGYAPEPAWTRGQAWAIAGFVQSYIHTKRPEFLDTAKRAAHYFIANMENYDVPPIDFLQPKEPWYVDTTAAAIAACGLLEIATNVETGGELYENAAIKLLEGLEKHCDFTNKEQSILQMGSEAYSMKKHIPIIYGDYYLLEALNMICGKNTLKFW